jgi:cysteine desulfurase
MRPIYMDHHGTTPVAPEVLRAMTPYFVEEFGNPASTTHAAGRRAAEAVERARGQVAGILGARSGEVLFTSGATESNNLALRGVAEAARERHGRAHVVTCAVEHKSILDTAADLERRGIAVTVLPVDRDGRVDPEEIRRALGPETCLVSIQFANSEIGTVQPMEEIGRVCAAARIPLHSDAAQAVGRLPVDVGGQRIQLLSLSGHKLYGPKGVGALVCHRRVRLRSQITGGGQEKDRRSGTVNVPGVVGLAAALELAASDREEEAARLGALRDALWEGIRRRIPHVKLNGHRQHRLPNNLNVSFRDVEGEALLTSLKGFALSSGSACTSGQSHGSHVVRALGGPAEDAHSSIRFGLGRGNTLEQVQHLVERLEVCVERLRVISGTRAPAATGAGATGSPDGAPL